MTNRKSLILFGLLLLFGVSSCDDPWFDVQDVALEPWQPTVALPLIDSEVDIYDLTTGLDSAYLNTQQGGLVEFVYQDSLISTTIGDLIEIPDFSAAGEEDFTLPEFDDIAIAASASMSEILGDVPLAEGQPIPPFSGVQFSESLPEVSSFQQASFQSGSVRISIRNNFNAQIRFGLRLVDEDSGERVVNTSFDIAANGSQAQEVSLAGKSFGNALRYEIVNLSSPGSNQGYSRDSNLAFEVELRDMRFNSVTFINNEDYAIEEDIVLPLDMPNGIELYTTALEGGEVSYSLSSNVGIDLEATMIFTSATQGGAVLSQSIPLSGGSGSGTIDLADIDIDFTQLDQGFNQLPATLRVVIPGNGQTVTLRQSNRIAYNTSIRNLVFSSLTGYLGQQEIALEGDSVGISVFENTLSGVEVELSLVDPVLEFTVENEYGVPFDFSMSPIYASKNESNSLLPIEVDPNPARIEAGSINNPSRRKLSVGNLNEIINFRPHSVIYDAGVRLNPAGRSVNAVDASQRVIVVANAVIPLHGRVNLLSISDPIEADLSNQDELEDIESLSLNIRIENEFPVELMPQFYFYDRNGTLIDSVFIAGDDNVFPAAEVDGEGISMGAVTTEREIQIRDSFLEKFTDTHSISLKLRLLTADSGNTNVKILDSYKIRASLGALAEVKINP